MWHAQVWEQSRDKLGIMKQSTQPGGGLDGWHLVPRGGGGTMWHGACEATVYLYGLECVAASLAVGQVGVMETAN